MGEVHRPRPVKPVAGLLSAREDLLDEAGRRLEGILGPLDRVSPTLDFDATDYYVPEMGEGIRRRYLSFRDLIPPGRLPGLKIAANELEAMLGDGSAFPRPVNIDPGYVAMHRLVLASTKDGPHRLYIGEGVFGELTLLYRSGSFTPLPWTYADYRTGEARRFFGEVREMYKEQLRAEGG
jgi:hypothetical protein